MIEACIFDLDGVIVDTAKYHFKAWRSMANDLGFDFTEVQNEELKGVSRMGSLNMILDWGGKSLSEDKKIEWATRKNDRYLKSVHKMDQSEILPGIVEFLEDLKNKNIRIALGSASKNARLILEQTGIIHYFEAIMDGTNVTKSKPHPEVFLNAAAALNTPPSKCLVFEDAPKGVDAALAGGMYVVGIGEKAHLGHAHLVFPNLENRLLDSIEIKLKELVS